MSMAELGLAEDRSTGLDFELADWAAPRRQVPAPSGTMFPNFEWRGFAVKPPTLLMGVMKLKELFALNDIFNYITHVAFHTKLRYPYHKRHHEYTGLGLG